jgi:hypothetical protein
VHCSVLSTERDQLRARIFSHIEGHKGQKEGEGGRGTRGKGLHDALFLSALERDGPRS